MAAACSIFTMVGLNLYLVCVSPAHSDPDKDDSVLCDTGRARLDQKKEG